MSIKNQTYDHTYLKHIKHTMKKLKFTLILLLTSLVFLLCNGLECKAQSNDWGIRINGKKWYYERGEIFRGTKERCEQKCKELNFHPSSGGINVAETGARMGLDPRFLPSQATMDNLAKGLDEERRKNASVYSPERITVANLNDNDSPELKAITSGQTAQNNAESNNKYVTTTISNDSRFTKENTGFVGEPQPSNQPRPRNEILQENTNCNCSTLISDTEYKNWAVEFVHSGQLAKEFNTFANEKYSICLNKYQYNRNENDFKVFYKKLMKLTNQEIEKMFVN